MSKVKRSAAYKAFRVSRIPEMEAEFKKTLRILSEHQKRHTQEMFAPGNFDEKTGEGIYNKDLARDAFEFTKAQKLITDQYIRIQKQAVMEASLMSFEDRMHHFVEWFLDERAVGKLNRRKGCQILYKALNEAEYIDVQLKKKSRETYREYDRALADEPDPEDTFHFTKNEQAADQEDDAKAPERWTGEDGLERYEVNEDE